MAATLTDYFDELKTLDEDNPIAKVQQCKPRSKAIKHPPDTDIVFWLRSNAPLNFPELRRPSILPLPSLQQIWLHGREMGQG